MRPCASPMERTTTHRIGNGYLQMRSRPRMHQSTFPSARNDSAQSSEGVTVLTMLALVGHRWRGVPGPSVSTVISSFLKRKGPAEGLCWMQCVITLARTYENVIHLLNIGEGILHLVLWLQPIFFQSIADPNEESLSSYRPSLGTPQIGAVGGRERRL